MQRVLKHAAAILLFNYSEVYHPIQISLLKQFVLSPKSCFIYQSTKAKSRRNIYLFQFYQI